MSSLDSMLDHENLLSSLHPSTADSVVICGEAGGCGEVGGENCRNPLGLIPLDLELAPADYQTLLDELAQAHQLDQERRTRIHHLEKALDQALACLEELRAQIHDQHFLETQLANTEDYSSVQQQAIARLKLQLAEQQQALDAQVLETQQRDQAIQELLVTIEAMTQAQQREVERLRSRLAQDQQDVQTHRSRLGKQLQDLQIVLESRQQRVGELEHEIWTARTLATQLQGQLELAQQQIHELSTRISQYSQHRARPKPIENWEVKPSPGIPTLGIPTAVPASCSAPALPDASTSSATWLKTPQQADELEKRLGLQLAQQARWQQQQHELESDREQLQNRVVALEQQIAEMQEQILRQAQQETEYETAVQYWKDRHLTRQHQAHHLKDLTEQFLAQVNPQELSPSLMELLNALQATLDPESSESKPHLPLPLPRLTTVELPEFLVRRRAAQKNLGTEPLPPQSL